MAYGSDASAKCLRDWWEVHDRPSVEEKLHWLSTAGHRAHWQPLLERAMRQQLSGNDASEAFLTENLDAIEEHGFAAWVWIEKAAAGERPPTAPSWTGSDPGWSDRGLALPAPAGEPEDRFCDAVSVGHGQA